MVFIFLLLYFMLFLLENCIIFIIKTVKLASRRRPFQSVTMKGMLGVGMKKT